VTPTFLQSGYFALNVSLSATATGTPALGSMTNFMRSQTSRVAATISSSVTVMTSSTLRSITGLDRVDVEESDACVRACVRWTVRGGSRALYVRKDVTDATTLTKNHRNRIEERKGDDLAQSPPKSKKKSARTTSGCPGSFGGRRRSCPGFGPGGSGHRWPSTARSRRPEVGLIRIRHQNEREVTGISRRQLQKQSKGSGSK